MGDAVNPCRSCGADVGAENPPNPQHCGNCPPWLCEDCGEMCSIAATCSCWTDLTGMSAADIKAVFAELEDCDCHDEHLSLDPVVGDE